MKIRKFYRKFHVHWFVIFVINFWIFLGWLNYSYLRGDDCTVHQHSEPSSGRSIAHSRVDCFLLFRFSSDDLSPNMFGPTIGCKYCIFSPFCSNWICNGQRWSFVLVKIIVFIRFFRFSMKWKIKVIFWFFWV